MTVRNIWEKHCFSHIYQEKLSSELFGNVANMSFLLKGGSAMEEEDII